MTTFLLEFQGWHWNAAALGDPELRGAFEAMNEPTTTEDFERGFLTLLRSDDTAARGIALDFYDRAEMTERFVGGNVLEDHAEEVFRVARVLLRQPPVSREDGQAEIEGANHASALAALWRFGLEDEDTEAVIRVLERMPEETLRRCALDAAGVLLESSDPPDPVLNAVVARVGVCFDRVEAIRELRDSADAEAIERLLLATRDDEWRVRQEAAAALASRFRFYSHRTLLEELVETWADDERSEAFDEVREALSEGPHSRFWEDTELNGELLEAHRRLRLPTSEDVHHQAFRALLRSGSAPAVGIALDHFHLVDGLTRFGIDDDEYSAEVLTIARAILGRPSEADGADHASALGILGELGVPEDAPSIAAALRTREAPAVVLESAVDAAFDCLDRWETPDRDVVAALDEFIFDGSLDLDLRAHAVSALMGLGPVAQVTAVLTRAVRSGELRVQVEAAIALTFQALIDDHRALLREVVASWPQDAGARAEAVRATLADS